jgi:hypothetical protein
MAHTRGLFTSCLGAAALLSACARPPVALLAGQGEPARTPGFETRLRAEVRAGPVNGYLQTPKGGTPGTTSLKRPTFDEVGAETLIAPTADLRFAFGRHRVHLGASWWMLHGDETLQQDLTSHDDFYPAGTAMTSDTDILASWLGYGYAFELGRQAGALTVTPGVGVYAYGQKYGISGGGEESTRDFTSISPMFDAELLWYPGGRIHVSGGLMLVLDELLGVSSPTNAVDAVVRLHWDISRTANVFLSLGYSRLEHFDEQVVPNHAEIESLPWFGIGGELRF